jgi:hypothetical protein
MEEKKHREAENNTKKQNKWTKELINRYWYLYQVLQSSLSNYKKEKDKR